MSIPKAKKLRGQSSQSPKQTMQSQRTATTHTASGRSSKRTSNRSPAPTNTQTSKVLNKKLIDEPLNRVLIVDHNSLDAEFNLAPKNLRRTWYEMNLIIAIDYGRSVFHVLKNRWGANPIDVPVDLLATFLYYPETADIQELNREKSRRDKFA